MVLCRQAELGVVAFFSVEEIHFTFCCTVGRFLLCRRRLKGLVSEEGVLSVIGRRWGKRMNGFMIGVVASIGMSMGSGLGIAVQRRSHVEEEKRPLEEQRAYVRRPLWIFGAENRRGGGLKDMKRRKKTK